MSEKNNSINVMKDENQELKEKIFNLTEEIKTRKQLG